MIFRQLMQALAYPLGIAVMLLPLPASSAAQQAQSGASAQQQSAPSESGSIPVIRTTTTLVFLDVTVLDKMGHPVVTGLTRDDFSITENKKPQRIFSFEAPNSEGSGDGELPKTVLVLDLLNTSFADFAYVRDQARQFLVRQPEDLQQETELMVVGNQTLELLQGFTHSRKDLLFALDHLPPALPYKATDESLTLDRIRQSYIALQQIAIQNRGIPGRKNVMWIGNGSPNLSASEIPDPIYDEVQQYVHRTVNMMVEARITLFLIYPVMQVGRFQFKLPHSSISEGNTSDPFADSSFTKFVYETGGKVFSLNDVSREIYDSTQLGSHFYTLTYQPHEEKPDGAFRKIRVTLRNPDLHVMTKIGYFAQDPREAAGSDNKTVNILTEASLAAIPMNALHVTVAKIVRHPDAHTVEITVQLDDKKLGWESIANSLSQTAVLVSAVSMSAHGDLLATRIAKYALTAKSQDASRLADSKPEIDFTLRLPRGAKNIRVAVATNDGGRIGSLDLSRQSIDSAPEAPTPNPILRARSRAPVRMQ